MQLTDESLTKIAVLQRNEITEHYIYQKIAQVTPGPRNREVLTRISGEEIKHYSTWKQYTGRDIAPAMLRVWFYSIVAHLLGMTFAIKLMEGVEQGAQIGDPALLSAIPELPAMLADEAKHERELIALIDEERLKYVGSVVLGLNDALVEFTGTLAGLTFAIQNSRIIAVVGLITGVAASLSMAASEYLSQRSEGTTGTSPKKAALYTGATYIVTVALLILPFLILRSPYFALVFTLIGAVLVIFVFTFYISVAKDLPFWKRFAEMAAISLGVGVVNNSSLALLSLGEQYLVRIASDQANFTDVLFEDTDTEMNILAAQTAQFQRNAPVISSTPAYPENDPPPNPLSGAVLYFAPGSTATSDSQEARTLTGLAGALKAVYTSDDDMTSI